MTNNKYLFCNDVLVQNYRDPGQLVGGLDPDVHGDLDLDVLVLKDGLRQAEGD